MMHTSQFHKIDPYDWFCTFEKYILLYNSNLEIVIVLLVIISSLPNIKSIKVFI